MFSTRFDTGYVTLETSDLDLRVREKFITNNTEIE